MAVTAP